ncbi:MAG: hypothetical protein HZC48_08050 [Nitrospirae bacterium]|nr:hypothetical protein [Nitrospirota bacterium]
MNLKSISKIFLIVSIPVVFLSLLSSHAISADETTDYPVPPPPFSEGIFPCSGCHAGMEVNTNIRELSFHEDIKLKHFDGWCFNCHNPDNRDVLRLASGKIITFKESEYLCGQCHGEKFRNWKVGVHGKRTGLWNGRKEYRLCVHCHSPHQPRFKPLKPLPPPVRPEDSKYKTIEQIPLNPLNSIKE